MYTLERVIEKGSEMKFKSLKEMDGKVVKLEVIELGTDEGDWYRVNGKKSWDLNVNESVELSDRIVVVSDGEYWTGLGVKVGDEIELIYEVSMEEMLEKFNGKELDID